jgi:hypothetical protein
MKQFLTAGKNHFRNIDIAAAGRYRKVKVERPYGRWHTENQKNLFPGN